MECAQYQPLERLASILFLYLPLIKHLVVDLRDKRVSAGVEVSGSGYNQLSCAFRIQPQDAGP